MIDIDRIKGFVAPFYRNLDIMHDLSHIERMLLSAEKLMKNRDAKIDAEAIGYAAYFHGLTDEHGDAIFKWLMANGMDEEKARLVISIAEDSLKSAVPRTLEGTILHDAHMIEGGKTFLIVKSLITGSVRGQTLDQTIEYIEENILNKGTCYLPEAREIYREEQAFAKQLVNDLKKGLYS